MDEAEDKKTLLVGLFSFVNGKSPPLEEGTTPRKAKVKTVGGESAKIRGKGKC